MKSLAQDDCLLFMWVTSPHQDQAIELMQAWGFKYITVAFVWDKVRVNPGSYTMSQGELVLLGKRGKIPQPRGARNVRQYFKSKRTAHSEKPAEIAERIVRMFPHHRRLELFARKRVDGWDCHGNQVDADVRLS